MSTSEPRKVCVKIEVIMVDNLVHQCLQHYMTKEDTIVSRGKVEPLLVQLVWQGLKDENPEFFQDYNKKVMAKNDVQTSTSPLVYKMVPVSISELHVILEGSGFRPTSPTQCPSTTKGAGDEDDDIQSRRRYTDDEILALIKNSISQEKLAQLLANHGYASNTNTPNYDMDENGVLLPVLISKKIVPSRVELPHEEMVRKFMPTPRLVNKEIMKNPDNRKITRGELEIHSMHDLHKMNESAMECPKLSQHGIESIVETMNLGSGLQQQRNKNESCDDVLRSLHFPVVSGRKLAQQNKKLRNMVMPNLEYLAKIPGDLRCTDLTTWSDEDSVMMINDDLGGDKRNIELEEVEEKNEAEDLIIFNDYIMD